MDPHHSDATPDVRATLRVRLKESMVARDKAAVSVLRGALAAIENAEAQPLGDASPTEMVLEAAHAPDVPRRVVTDEEARAIVAAEVAELGDAAEEYGPLGQLEAAAEVRHQAEVLRSVLDPTR